MTDYNDLPLEHPAGHSLPMSLLADGVAARHGRRADDEEDEATRGIHMIADPHIEKLPDPHDIKRRVAEIVAEVAADYGVHTRHDANIVQAMALRIAAMEHKVVLARAQLVPGEVSD